MKRKVFFLAAVMSVLCFLLAACAAEEPAVPVVSTEPQTVKVTIPEGYAVRRIAEKLDENGVCSASDFFAACSDTDWSAEFSFLPSHDTLSEREYPLEGYLFPDTYEFYVGEEAHSCVRRFLRTFKIRFDPQMVSDCDATGLSVDEIVTLASIVEKETNSREQAPRVAAVFFNRLNHPYGINGVDGTSTGGRFQSDATKYYPYTYAEHVDGLIPEDFESEYNTYNFEGLPKGPICCPSLVSLKACVYPDSSCDAFFFFTDKNSTYYYAVTYDEHKANIKNCRDNGLT